MYNQEHQEPDYASHDVDAPPDKTADTAQPTRWSPDSWFEWRLKYRGRRYS